VDYLVELIIFPTKVVAHNSKALSIRFIQINLLL
jgi:hypothetical protein